MSPARSLFWLDRMPASSLATPSPSTVVSSCREHHLIEAIQCEIPPPMVLNRSKVIHAPCVALDFSARLNSGIGELFDQPNSPLVRLRLRIPTSILTSGGDHIGNKTLEMK